MSIQTFNKSCDLTKTLLDKYFYFGNYTRLDFSKTVNDVFQHFYKNHCAREGELSAAFKSFDQKTILNTGLNCRAKRIEEKLVEKKEIQLSKKNIEALSGVRASMFCYGKFRLANDEGDFFSDGKRLFVCLNNQTLGAGSEGRVHLGFELEPFGKVRLLAVKVKQTVDRELEFLEKCKGPYIIGTVFYNGSHIFLQKAVGPLVKFSEEYAKTEEAMHVVANCAYAISLIHDKKVIHRDIKPSNFLFFFDEGNEEKVGHVKLADFGLANFEDEPSKKLNGTPLFMAPECFDESFPITNKVDIWALGCTILTLFCGQKSLPWYKLFLKKSSLAEMKPILLDYFSHLPENWQTQLPLTGNEKIDALIPKIFQIDPKARPTASEIVDICS